MSRIEEALRRAGDPRTSLLDPKDAEADAFQSPWEFADRDGSTTEKPHSSATRETTAVHEEAPSSALTLLDKTPFRDFRADWKERLIATGVHPALISQFRRLAAALIHGQRESGLKAIMIASAVPGEGKTLTALHLATVLSESYGRRVLIVDADLRRPRITEAVNHSAVDGLGEALRSSEPRQVGLVQLTQNLTLLPAGRPDPDPLSSLTSARMQQMLKEAVERFDWVIVDTPPVDAAADTGLLGAMVDATVLVVRANQTPHGAVKQAIDTLGRDRIFGVVLNGVSEKAVPSYSDYSSYAPGK
jgi:capsular exopolysaccharide synthesis family protein